MVKALSEPGAKKLPVFDFKPDIADSEGDLINPAWWTPGFAWDLSLSQQRRRSRAGCTENGGVVAE